MTLDMHEVWPAIRATPIGSGSDSIAWIPTSDGLTYRSAWEAVHQRNPEVPWASLIWNGGAVPRHAFCT